MNEEGHQQHHRMMIRDFRRRFFVTVILTLPVLALAGIVQDALGFSLSFAGDS